jgi:hypothetical protein
MVPASLSHIALQEKEKRLHGLSLFKQQRHQPPSAAPIASWHYIILDSNSSSLQNHGLILEERSELPRQVDHKNSLSNQIKSFVPAHD